MHIPNISLFRRVLAAAPVLAILLAAPGLAHAGAMDAKPVAHAPDPDLAAEGKRIYHTHCVHCHGPNMLNAGAAQAYNLKKFPLDQKARFFNSVKKGKNTMPAWADLIPDDEIEALWAYLETRGE